MGKLIDLTGKRFGRWLVLRREGISSQKKPLWLCRCDCDREKLIDGNSLRQGMSTSCGCLRNEKTSETFIDITGQKFGRLFVVKRTDDYISKQGKRLVRYLCRCDCGKSVKVAGTQLRSLKTQSCGCLKSEVTAKRNLKDMIGKRFGLLVVLERYGLDASGKPTYLCKCDCGIKCVTSGKFLRNGSTKSCGCLTESFVASQLKKYCIETYSAIPEYEELRSPETGWYLPYDIFIPDKNIYIEVNGIQHYEYVKHFYKTQEDFEHRQHLDQLKRQHAEQNGKFIEVDLRVIKTPEQGIELVNGFIRKGI